MGKLQAYCKNFWTKLIFTVSAIMGSFIILYPIYLRILRKNLPVQLPIDVLSQKNYGFLIISILCFIFWAYIFIRATRVLIYDHFSIGSLPKDNKIMIIAKNFFYHGIENFYRLINKIPGMESFYSKIMTPLILFLLRHMKTRKHLMILVLILNFIPKSIFLTCFVFDVFVKYTFYYSYLLGPILLVPMFERYILFWLFLYRKKNLYFFNDYLCLYDRINFTKKHTITEYILSNIFIELKNSIENKNYIIKTSFPVLWHNVIIGLDSNFYLKNEKTIKSSKQRKTLKEIVDKLQDIHIPLIIFGDFYEIFKNVMFKYFIFLQSFCHILTWVFILRYIA